MADFLDWVDAMDDYFDETNPPEDLKCEVAASRLRGAALSWWKGRQNCRLMEGKNLISSWPRMRKILSSKFLLTTCSTESPLKLYNHEKEVLEQMAAEKFMPTKCSTKLPNDWKGEIGQCWSTYELKNMGKSSTVHFNESITSKFEGSSSIFASMEELEVVICGPDEGDYLVTEEIEEYDDIEYDDAMYEGLAFLFKSEIENGEQWKPSAVKNHITTNCLIGSPSKHIGSEYVNVTFGTLGHEVGVEHEASKTNKAVNIGFQASNISVVLEKRLELSCVNALVALDGELKISKGKRPVLKERLDLEDLNRRNYRYRDADTASDLTNVEEGVVMSMCRFVPTSVDAYLTPFIKAYLYGFLFKFKDFYTIRWSLSGHGTSKPLVLMSASSEVPLRNAEQRELPYSLTRPGNLMYSVDFCPYDNVHESLMEACWTTGVRFMLLQHLPKVHMPITFLFDPGGSPIFLKIGNYLFPNYGILLNEAANSRILLTIACLKGEGETNKPIGFVKKELVSVISDFKGSGLVCVGAALMRTDRDLNLNMVEWCFVVPAYNESECMVLNSNHYMAKVVMHFLDLGEAYIITGVLVHWLDIGMYLSSICWYVDNHHLYPLNYMNIGDPEIPYIVPTINVPKQKGKFMVALEVAGTLDCMASRLGMHGKVIGTIDTYALASMLLEFLLHRNLNANRYIKGLETLPYRAATIFKEGEFDQTEHFAIHMRLLTGNVRSELGFIEQHLSLALSWNIQSIETHNCEMELFTFDPGGCCSINKFKGQLMFPFYPGAYIIKKLIDIFMRDGPEKDKYAKEELEKMALDKLFNENMQRRAVILDISRSCFFPIVKNMISSSIHYLIEDSKTLQGAKELDIHHVLGAKCHVICITVRLMNNLVKIDKYDELPLGKFRFMLFHGHWNSNTIIAKLCIVTISSCLSVWYSNEQSRKSLRLFHKVVNGLDPPIDLDGACEAQCGFLQVRSWTSFRVEGWYDVGTSK